MLVGAHAPAVSLSNPPSTSHTRRLIEPCTLSVSTTKHHHPLPPFMHTPCTHHAHPAQHAPTATTHAHAMHQPCTHHAHHAPTATIHAEPTTSGAAAPHKPQQPGKRVPVWADPADAEVSVNLASKARLRKLRASHGQQEIDGECSSHQDLQTCFLGSRTLLCLLMLLLRGSLLRSIISAPDEQQLRGSRRKQGMGGGGDFVAFAMS